MYLSLLISNQPNYLYELIQLLSFLVKLPNYYHEHKHLLSPLFMFTFYRSSYITLMVFLILNTYGKDLTLLNE